MSKISVGRIVSMAKSAINVQKNQSLTGTKGLIGNSNSEISTLLNELGAEQNKIAGFDGNILEKAKTLVDENKMKEFQQEAEKKALEVSSGASEQIPDADTLAKEMEAEAQATISRLETEGAPDVQTFQP